MLTILLLIFAATLPAVTRAQTPTSLEGLQVITERQYAMDPSKPIDTGTEGLFVATVRVYQFDSAENAEPVYESLVKADGITSQLPVDGSAKLETVTLDDVGDQAAVLKLAADLPDGEEGHFQIALVQKDALVVSVTVVAGSEDAAGAAEVIAAAMIEREPGSAPSVYEGNGKSTGGVWEMYLPADADELQGLQAYMDKETRPAN